MSETSKPTLRHLGLILDGNRRWASLRGLPALEGHRQGYKNVKNILRAIKESDIEFVSLYVFSTENWQRSSEEVQGLMKLLTWVLTKELKELMKEERKLLILGSRKNVPENMLQLMDRAEEQTRHFDKGTLAICFNYGGHQEIVDAAQSVVEAGEPITVESLSGHLYQPDVPPIDLLVRTSGEKRISNFMLWRVSYAELAFTDTLWPDFTPEELQAIIDEYLGRKRRFGA